VHLRVVGGLIGGRLGGGSCMMGGTSSITTLLLGTVTEFSISKNSDTSSEYEAKRSTSSR
jgi:hypothetical protein